MSTAVSHTSKEVSLRRAEQLSKSKLQPEHFYKQPENILYVMEIGNALGVDPVSALWYIHVWKNKKTGQLQCSLSADLMVALARAAGHIVHVQGNSQKAVATLVRGDMTQERLDALQRLQDIERDRVRKKIEDIKMLKEIGVDPSDSEISSLKKEMNSVSVRPEDYFIFKEVWDEERAQNSGLLNRNTEGPWTYARPDMYKARCKSGVVRMGASEVLVRVKNTLSEMGVQFSEDEDVQLLVDSAHYTADELGAETDEDGVPVGSVTLAREASGYLEEDHRHSEENISSGVPQPILDSIQGSPPSEIINLVQEIIDNESLPDDKRLTQVYYITQGCNTLGRRNDSFSFNGKSAKLGDILDRYLLQLQNK